MNWQKDIVRRTMEGAGDYPGVQLQFLLQRLEECPGAVPHIADAIRDMGEWYLRHADELECEVRRRNGGPEVVSLPNPEGAA